MADIAISQESFYFIAVDYLVTRAPVTCAPSDSLVVMAGIMDQHNISGIVAVEDGRPVGGPAFLEIPAGEDLDPQGRNEAGVQVSRPRTVIRRPTGSHWDCASSHRRNSVAWSSTACVGAVRSIPGRRTARLCQTDAWSCHWRSALASSRH